MNMAQIKFQNDIQSNPSRSWSGVSFRILREINPDTSLRSQNLYYDCYRTPSYNFHQNISNNLGESFFKFHWVLWPYRCWRAFSTGSLTQCLADLTSPASSENTPPADGSRKLPRCSWPRRRREKQPAVSANENSASRVADPATSLRPSANGNSAPRAATQPRSTANRNSPFPGPQPGTSHALVKHLQTFQYPQHPQHPKSTTNQNTERRSRLGHPEIRGEYKPAQHSIREHTQANRHRDTFSGSGLSSPALQQPTHKSFSGSPAGPLQLTDPKREARDPGGSRPGLIFPLPRAARPDTPGGNRRCPTWSCCLEPGRTASHGVGHRRGGPSRRDSLSRTLPAAWIALAQAPIPQTAQEPLLWSVQAQEALSTATGVSSSLLLV